MSSSRPGIVTFAAVVFLILGALDLVWGVSALANKDYFDEESLLFASLQAWGWVYLVVGAIQVTIGVLVLRESGYGFGFGMFAAFLGILVNFVSIGAYPLWSVMLIALNFLVLFVLATRAGE